MKTVILFLAFLVVGHFGFSQNKTFDLKINGKSNQSTLSKSQENLISISCPDCNNISISGSSLTLLKDERGWIAYPSSLTKTATLTVFCTKNGKMIEIGKKEFKIVD